MNVTLRVIAIHPSRVADLSSNVHSIGEFQEEHKILLRV